ncbi:MAG: CRTAC1 family protein, partial [Phycisphaerae bacterium]
DLVRKHQLIAKSLNESGKSVRYWSNEYTEHGPYARAMPLFGFGSSAQIAESKAPIRWEDVTERVGVDSRPATLDETAGLTWLDADNDGDLDLLAPGGRADGEARPMRLWKYQAPSGERDRASLATFLEAADEAGLSAFSGITAAVSADWDRDGDVDLLLAGPTGCRPLLNQGGRFVLPEDGLGIDWPGATGQPSLEDIDHDGDEDLCVPGVVGSGDAKGANAVFRNLSTRPPVAQWASGRGAAAPSLRFKAANQEWAIGVDLPGVVGVLWTDFDRDVDSDAVLFGSFEPGIAIYENRREDGFVRVADHVLNGWRAGRVCGATLADIDNNGRLDIIVSRDQPPVLSVLLNKRGRFVQDVAIEAVLSRSWTAAWGVAALDADNDGDLDLVAVVAAGDPAQSELVTLRNGRAGRFQFDADRDSIRLQGLGRVVAPADFDQDGRVDLAVRLADGSVRLLRNVTDNGFAGRQFRLRRSRLTDAIWKFSCPVGAKLRVQAGKFAQLRRSATASGYFAQASPFVHVGLADRLRSHGGRALDGIEVFWASGAIQGVTAELPPASTVVDIREIDVRPASCPFLFVWDGERYRFLGDVMVGSPPGLYIAPGVYAACDTDEYIRVPEGLLAPRDGAFDIVIHECLREIAFFDRAELIAVDHADDVVVYPNERFSGPPPFVEHKLFALDALISPSTAVDHRGVDCAAELAEADDGRSVHEFAHLDIPGFAEPHAIELTFDDVPADRDLVLLLHGYLKLPGSPAQYVAAERGLRFQMPKLERRRADGAWDTLVENIGAPAGFPRTMTVELTGLLQPGASRLR